MSRRNPGLPSVVGACLFLLASASLAFGQQTADQQNCLNKLNKDGAGVSKAQGKENAGCLKKAGKGQLLGTAQACLTADEKMKVAGKKNKTIAHDSENCGTAPDFGYTGAATVNTAAVQGQIDLVADIFGTPLDTAVISCDTNSTGCLCQQTVLKDVEKLAATKMKEFVKCKKQVLKDGGNSAASLVACVNDQATAGSIAQDTKAKILKKRGKLDADVLEKCGTPESSAAFPNECATLTGTALGDCLDRLVECRICQTINEMDGILVNCDLFDDDMANSTCASGAGPTPTATDTPTVGPTATATATSTATSTASVTNTPGSTIFQGALLKTTGWFTYSAMTGVPGANTSCNANFPGSHACEFSELLAAEALGELVGVKDIGNNTITSFWAIDPTHSNFVQCGVTVHWDYATAHTGHNSERANLTNATGDLGPVITGLQCFQQHWVGCCL